MQEDNNYFAVHSLRNEEKIGHHLLYYYVFNINKKNNMAKAKCQFYDTYHHT